MTDVSRSASAFVSVVVPVYFNEENIPVTWPALKATLEALPLGFRWEIVFVDDGSSDASYERLLEVYESAPSHTKVVKLTRNFGQVAAMLAGLREARGDCCIFISADLQDPPELMLEMVRRWDHGACKIVLATRTHREDPPLARWASRVFYRLMRRYAIPNMPEGGFDYFLVDRRVMDLMNGFEEKNTFIQGQVLWTGFKPEIIGYSRRRRETGQSRWTVSRKIKYFVDGFVTYTVVPIRLITAVGLVVSILSFAYATLIFFLKLIWQIPVQGWAPTMISILLLAGVQLVMLGIIGEYLWRNYYETRRLPNFIVDTVISGDKNPSVPS